MLIECGNLHARIVRATDDERTWLREYLSFEDTTAKFAKKRYGSGDGRVRMFDIFTGTFPTGLLPLVRKAGPMEGFQIDLLDSRKKPCEPDSTADLTWLRDYQLAAVARAVHAGRGIISAPTGSGKTELAIALRQVFPCRWLFLVHRTTLVEQAAERFTLRTGQIADIIGEGRWDNTGASFTVATFQSIHAALKRNDPRALALLGQAGGIIVDECHVLPSESFWRVAMRAQQAYYRIGLSGTPLARGDRRSLLAIAALGPIIYRIQPDVLIAAGVLAKPRIQLVPVAQLSDCKTWQGVYGECIVRSRTRNQTIVDCARKAEKPCLVFVKEIQHGRLLTERLLKADLRAEFVFGADSTPERQAATRRLVRGDLDVLVSSVIFQEGVDIPQLRSVVIANGGKSVIAALQRIGRGMRVTADKSTFQVFDVADHGSRLLERHTRARVRAYTSQGYETVEAML
jgi:superfamily II DNA or RNA helicase